MGAEAEVALEARAMQPELEELRLAAPPVPVAAARERRTAHSALAVRAVKPEQGVPAALEWARSEPQPVARSALQG